MERCHRILTTIIVFSVSVIFCAGPVHADWLDNNSGYIKIQPGESLREQQWKQSYNLNNYLNQKDAERNESEG